MDPRSEAMVDKRLGDVNLREDAEREEVDTGLGIPSWSCVGCEPDSPCKGRLWMLKSKTCFGRLLLPNS